MLIITYSINYYQSRESDISIEGTTHSTALETHWSLEMDDSGQEDGARKQNTREGQWETRDPRRRKRSLNSGDEQAPSTRTTAPTSRKRHAVVPTKSPTTVETHNEFQTLMDTDDKSCTGNLSDEAEITAEKNDFNPQDTRQQKSQTTKKNKNTSNGNKHQQNNRNN